MLCGAVLMGGEAGNTWFEVHTFLVAVYAHIELQRKATVWVMRSGTFDVKDK
jgi:hypothetical protein